MGTELIDVLRAELASVGRQVEEIRAQEHGVKAEMAERLRRLAEEAMRLQARMRHIQALLALEGHPVASGLAEVEEGSANAGARSLADNVYDLLLEAGREHHYQELAAELELRGIHVPGKDPPKNLVAHIHRDPRFVRPKRGVYGLREWYRKGMRSVGVRRRKSRRKRAPGAKTGE